MRHPKILAIVLAGGEGNRMGALTQQIAKPALPFAGVYRLIDFPLSNCVHSGIEDVWVIEQFQPHSINEHLTNGRPWDLDRTRGGLRIMPPQKSGDEGDGESGWHQGNADALFRNSRFIREFNADYILILSADAIYKLDYRDVIEAHQQREAEVTMVTTRVSPDEAKRLGNVRVDEEGRVTHFDYKPEKPQSDLATTEVFVYTASVLLDALDELAQRDNEGEDEENEEDEKENGGPALKDFGHELLPEMVSRGRAWSFSLDGYWRDVGTVDSYYQVHCEFLREAPPLVLDEAHWPILTLSEPRLPARLVASANVEDSLVASGCRIAGRVARSVLSPGVVVEKGAVVEDAIVLHDAVIATGATVKRAIIDAGARIERDSQIGHDGGEITVVERAAQLAPSTQITPGDTAL